jgi:hypothetical protein
MSRPYVCTFEGTAVTVAVDLFELAPADDKPIEITGLFISQSSDLGDAAEEIIRYEIVRGNTTTGTGGTQAATPVPLRIGDAAAGFTYDSLNTTQATAGTVVVLHAGAFNIRAGEAIWFPEGWGPTTTQSTFICVRLMAAPADSLTMSGTLYVSEV